MQLPLVAQTGHCYTFSLPFSLGESAWVVRGGLASWATMGLVRTMKNEIHPEYFVTAVKCGCGNTFTTRSTRPELKVDICNACHPFYTGKLKFIDTAGRIEKFKNKFAAAGYASLNRGKKAEAKTES